MILGGIAVMIGLVYLPLGKIAALIAWPFVSYTIRLVELFDRVPSGVVVLGEFSLLFVILFYTALLTWTFAADRFYRIRPALKPAVIASTLAIVAILTWRTALAAPDGRLHLTFLKVGTADGILIETPAGRHILINGGPSTSQLSDELGRRIPPLSRQLDWLVVASTQEDQVAALPRTLERFPPRQVLWAGKTEASFPARQLEDWLTSQSIPITNAETGQTLDLGSGAVLKVLQTNPRGAILLIEWHEFRALLPIGVNFEALTELDYGKNVGSINVLLLAESGLGQVNPPEWIKNLRPQVVILSVEAGNQQGLPSEETIQALEGYSLLRTDQQGWISITSDGGQMWIEAEKP
jgi:competence protein ComEC